MSETTFVCDTNQEIGVHNKTNQLCCWGTCGLAAGNPSITIQAAVGGLEVGGRERFFTYIHKAMS